MTLKNIDIQNLSDSKENKLDKPLVKKLDFSSMKFGFHFNA